MFTGIVSCKGRLASSTPSPAGRRIELESPLGALVLGESVAVSGVCLTVVASSALGFAADVSPETLERTTLGRLAPGSVVNLERALTLADRLGGHLVTGHVDDIATVLRCEPFGEARRLELRIPVALARYVAQKGSVALDGVSLTVNEVSGDAFSVMLIPHTLAVTTLGELSEGGSANLEVDLIARYVARLASAGGGDR